MYDKYESPLSQRYASDYMLKLFSAQTRAETWRRLWVALARAQHNLGLPVTAEQVEELEAHISDVDFDDWTIDISRALKYSPSAGNFVADPKTESSEARRATEKSLA